MLAFDAKVILVSGAAGNLGQAVVEAFLKVNASVVALDHRSGRLEGQFDLINSNGKLHIFEGVDLMDRQAVLSLGNRVRDQAGLVDVIVNTVGGFTAGDPVHELKPETLQRMIDLNLKSFLNTSAGFCAASARERAGKGDHRRGARRAYRAARKLALMPLPRVRCCV